MLGVQESSSAAATGVAGPKSRGARHACSALAVLAAALGVLAAHPAAAAAHGPIAPVASDYRARITSAPPGLQAKVVDGDLRLWLRVPPADTVVVLDYRGAPYLRFSPAGVAVNERSEMYYLNQTPVAAVPPAGLTAATPPRWEGVSGGHSYEWHDGRLHALALVALAPGSSYAGRWQIMLRLDGRPASIAGGLWHAGAPSIVWFWPILVIVLCVLAAWRVRSPTLDARTARVLAVAALAATATAGLGHELHGRPSVSVFQYLELAVILAFVAWGAARVASARAGYFAYFAIAVVAAWEAVQLLPTLTDGFVLIALPAFLARTASVVGLGAAVGLALLVFRLADTAQGITGRMRPRPARAARGRDRGAREPV